MTSATGTCDAPPRRRAAGFTLVELVVVIAIIGIAAAAVVLSLPGDGDDVRRSAQRLAAHMNAARDAAILSGRPVQVMPAAQGWQAAGQPAVRLPAGQRLISEPEGAIIFDPTGLASPARLTVRQDSASASVTISAAGAVHAR